MFLNTGDMHNVTGKCARSESGWINMERNSFNICSPPAVSSGYSPAMRLLSVCLESETRYSTIALSLQANCTCVQKNTGFWLNPLRKVNMENPFKRKENLVYSLTFSTGNF